MANYQVSVPSKTLRTRLLTTDVQFSVNDILSWEGTSLTSADFGPIGFGVFRNADNTRVEFFTFDPTTVTSATSPISFIARGLDPHGSTVDGSGTKYDWNANETIVELGSNPPALFSQFMDNYNAQTIGGIKTFSEIPLTTAGDATSSNQFVRYEQVLALLTGSATVDKVTVSGKAGETVAAGNLVYLKSSDNRWWKADADTAASAENVQLGIAQGAGTAGNTITSGVLILGIDTNQTGLTADAKYYASNTAGAISTSVGTLEVSVGMAISATSLLFVPRFDQVITEDIQDALVGTSGTPSASNKYVTNADTTGTGTINRQSITNAHLYGDGSDGSATIGAGTTTLTKDMFYTDLTLSNGAILVPNGFRIFVSGTLTRNGTGMIAMNGGNASGSTGGTAKSTNTIFGGNSGSNGANGGASSTAGSSSSPSAVNGVLLNNGSNGGAAGAGGAGNSGNSPGAGGGSTGATANKVLTRVSNAMVAYNMLGFYSGVAYQLKSSATPAGGGGGGGGGTGSGGDAGGAGGAGGGAGADGGTIVVFAATVTDNGSGNIFEAKGGNGANGTVGSNGTASGSPSGAGGGGGGGAGGSGGLIVLVYKSKSGSLTTAVTAGTAGSGAAGGTATAPAAGGAAGSAGTAGSAGAYYEIQAL